MLNELVKYLLSRSSTDARRLGYLHEAIAIEARYKRVAGSWRLHTDNSRAAILDAAGRCHGHDTVVILGAGSLFDVPLSELARIFRQVHLVDIVYTIGTRLKLARYSNVTAHVHDMAGIASALAGWQCSANLPALQSPCLPAAVRPVDLIVSVNLLSQLALMPRTYLEKKCAYDVQLLDRWCRQLVRNHLSFLRRQKSHVCLITDTRHDVYDSHDQSLLAAEDMLYGQDIGTSERSWLWDLAPQGELDTGYNVMAQVEYHYWDGT